MDGIRQTKTVNGVEHKYVTLDGTVIRETYGNVTVDYFYDNNGSPLKIEVNDNGTTYTGYYVLNQQGDVIGIIDAQGNVLVKYFYNAWGLEVEEELINRSAEHPLKQYNALKYRGYYYDADLGLYYLNSRFYDPVICRFINSDALLSGIGGKLIGYNLFSYCFNSPTNLDDKNGNWPRFLKEIGSRAKYLMKFVIRVVMVPIKTVKVSAGMGIGIGVKGSANLKRIKVDAGVSTSISDSLSYDKGKFDIKNTTSTKVGITFNDVVDFSYSTGKEHSFFDEKCGCNILHDPFVEQSNCPANEKTQGAEFTVGISFGVYIGLGGEVFVGVDAKAFYDELKDVLNDSYTSPYY